ncbi:MAG: mechanosensitive ion channel [Prevotella sp.]|nr:mechanosensitive ion channel [Prevotella sp.]
MRRIATIALLLLMTIPSLAVLKEKNLDNTLSILRSELVESRKELMQQSGLMKEQREMVFNNIMDIMNKSNQNFLMLYSQKPGYIFDLTYACHEATEQYAQFQRNVLPFRTFLQNNDTEIARYDSLIANLSQMNLVRLSEKAKIDRNVCLTLAVNIRRTLKENSEQFTDYINYYKMTEQHLSHLNDYANNRYNDIQTSIFRNGSENYLTILGHLGTELRTTKSTFVDKYRPEQPVTSQWSSYVILGLFMIVLLCVAIAIGLNLLVVRILDSHNWLPEWVKTKQTCLVLTTSVLTIAVILGLVRLIFKDQNFVIMASGLLVEFTWLLGVILISLLIRLNDQQIKSAFRIYTPLIVVGFLVITFRIVLIPNALVNLIFPPILLVCMLWQWSVIKRHNNNIPRSDVLYSYTSLAVFIASVVCSWLGYTLLSVQLLIWWIMQLTFILTITCIRGLLKGWAATRGYDKEPITKTWFFSLISDVALPVLGVFSVMISIYFASDVFNLSDTTREIFSRNYINASGIKVSLFALAQVLNLYFLFKYLNVTVKELLRIYFEKSDMSTADTRNMMVKNVIQVVVWGAWMLISLGILHVDNKWLGIIAAGFSTGIGFAMKDILENIYYGISLMAGRVKVGDLIICDGIRGKVSSISYTSTMLEAVDGSVIAFTNSQMFTKNYKNMTKNHGYELVGLDVGVAYGTDIEKAKQLLIDAISKLDCVDHRRKPGIILKEFADSSVNLRITVWLPVLSSYGDSGRVLECVYNTLNENNIEIPFPQRDLHIITNG